MLGNETNFKLSKREKELLVYASNGFSIKQMAVLLKLSPYTIDSHNRNIIKKMEAKNMKEAIAKSIRNGIID
jgi:DNA-binding NarL/FixJ family response regulator